MTFDPTLPIVSDENRKRRFHREVKRRLRALARLLDLPPESYDLRNNYGGSAVSGEITLHHERFYLQVQQSVLGPECGILYRACRGRRDYAGGNNRFASLQLLNDLPALAERVREVLGR